MLCLEKQVCELLKPGGHKGKALPPTYIPYLFLFFSLGGNVKQKKTYWDKQTFMYSWSDIQLSPHKKWKPLKANGLLCTKENPS